MSDITSTGAKKMSNNFQVEFANPGLDLDHWEPIHHRSGGIVPPDPERDMREFFEAGGSFMERQGLDETALLPQRDIYNMPREELTPDEIAQVAEHKLERRLDRVAHCGQWHYGVSPETFKSYSYPWRCGDVVHCGQCRESAANTLRDQMIAQTFGEVNTIIVGEMSEDDAAMVLASLNKEDYRRYPAENGTVRLFVDTARAPASWEMPSEFQVLSPELIERINWMEMVVTPKGKNRSGKLGVKPPKPSKDNTADNLTPSGETVIDPVAGTVQLARPQRIEIREFAHTAPKDVFDGMVRYYGQDFLPRDATIKNLTTQHSGFIDFLAEKLRKSGFEILHWVVKDYVVKTFRIVPESKRVTQFRGIKNEPDWGQLAVPG
jgi:hypothetical protein